MSGRSRVLKNALWLGFATGGSLITSLVYGLLAARYLGPEDFGRFSLIVGVGALMANVAQGAGTSVLTVLSAQQYRPPGQLLLPGLLTQAVIGIACVALSVPLVLLLGRDRSLLVPALAYCGGSICLLMYSAPVAIFRGLNKMQWSVAQPIAGLLSLVGVWLAARGRVSLDRIVAASAGAQAAVLLIALIATIRLYPRESHLRISSRVVSEVFRKTLGLSGVTIFQSVHWKVGTIMVQLLGGAYALGIYAAGAKPVENIRTIPMVLMLSVFPSVSQMASEGTGGLRGSQVSYITLVLALMFPAVGALIALSPTIVSLLYGRAYAEASAVLSLSLLAVIPGTVHLILIMSLVARHAIGRLSIIYSTAIVVEVGVDALLYSRAGLVAAAIGAVVASVVTALMADMYAFPQAPVLRERRVAKMLVVGTACLGIPFTGILEHQRWMLCGLTIAAFVFAGLVLKMFPVGRAAAS